MRHVEKPLGLLARKAQPAVGPGVRELHLGQFFGAEDVVARFFGIDACRRVFLRPDEEYVHA